MSDFSKTFRKYVNQSNWWSLHCNGNQNDCALFPSGQMKSEVRQHFNIDNDEEILFVRDTSFWNERNQGTVITDKYFYLIPDNDKPDEGVMFAWQDIQKVTYNDATVYFWRNDNINDAYSIHVSWFLKDVDESSYGYYGRDIANILNECVKTAVDPIEAIYFDFAGKYDNESDPQKRIALIKEMMSRLPEESWPIASGYKLMGYCYLDLKDGENAIQCFYSAISHEACTYGSVFYGDVCYQIEGILNCDYFYEQTIDVIDEKRKYALMAANFSDNEVKHWSTNSEEITSRADAKLDFNQFNHEYLAHFHEVNYKNRKVLLIVDNYCNLFQDYFVTLSVEDDLSELSFPTGHPKVNEVYVAHPLSTNRYMPIEDYQLELIEDRVREFCELAQGLGATEINIECLNSNSNDSINSGNRNLSGGASRMSSVHGSGHDEYSHRLIEEISRSISLHQTFLPHKTPALPDNLLWYSGEPSWQRLYRQRMEGGLLTHEERIETKKSQVVDNREMKEIKAELEALFANMDVAFDKTEESKFEQQENAVLAISVKFAPLSQLTGEAPTTSQAPMLTSNEQKYIDEVKECLADGEITRTGRRLLNMHRERLGISENRAAELEASVATPQLTVEEKEYLEAYREACEDGQLSDKERRMLNRLRDMLGITEEQAREIEKQ